MADPWLLAYDGVDPGNERRREALCTLGNGYLATRGAAPEPNPTGYPGTYLAGCYNRLDTALPEVTSTDESIVNLPDWLPWTYAVDDGDWFDPSAVTILAYRQELDLRRGMLTRRIRYRDRAGRTSTLVQRRFVDMADPHRAALACTLYAHDWSGRVRVRSGVDASVTNSGVPRYGHLAGRHLRVHRLDACADGVLLADTETTRSRIRIATAVRTRLLGRPATEPSTVRDGDRIWHEFDVELAEATDLTVEKTAAYHTSRDRAICEPVEAALSAAGGAETFDRMAAGHVLAWRQLWDGVRLRFGGPPERLRTVRLHTFHLLQTLSPHTADLDVGVPARGLSGEAYRGHVFWDELFVLPTLTVRLPQVARSMLGYRYRRLPAARRAARAAGYAGAAYPWQSGSDGREESPSTHLNPLSDRWLPDHSQLARHVGLAVAYNVWHYDQATGDREFLSNRGAEIILEVARFFASLARYDRVRDRYVIRGVIGPDEFHTRYPGSDRPGIDNNAYTNVMAAWVLRRALDTLTELPAWRATELSERIGLDAHETSRWEQLTRRLLVPVLGNGMLAQFDGYDRLAELDWDAYRGRYGNIQRLDRILEAEGLDVNAYQASKQADVLMLFHLLSAPELTEVLDRLGCSFTPDAIPDTIDHYLARTAHGSTLSALVHAWVLARAHRRDADRYLGQALASDVADIQGGTTAEGIHLGAMAGSVDLLLRCFAGVETRGGALRIEPCWPAELGSLELRLRYREHVLAVTVRRDRVVVASAPGHQPPIAVRHRDTEFLLAPGGTVRFAP